MPPKKRKEKEKENKERKSKLKEREQQQEYDLPLLSGPNILIRPLPTTYLLKIHVCLCRSDEEKDSSESDKGENARSRTVTPVIR
jgi:hypothetical protein